MPVVLRAPTYQRVLGSTTIAAVAVLFGAHAATHRTVTTALSGAAAVISAAAAVRLLCLRVEVTPDVLVLVNWLRAVRLPWFEVARVRYDEHVGLVVRRKDGREWTAACFTTVPGALAFTREPARAAALRIDQIRRRRA